MDVAGCACRFIAGFIATVRRALSDRHTCTYRTLGLRGSVRVRICAARRFMQRSARTRSATTRGFDPLTR